MAVDIPTATPSYPILIKIPRRERDCLGFEGSDHMVGQTKLKNRFMISWIWLVIIINKDETKYPCIIANGAFLLNPEWEKEQLSDYCPYL